MIKKATVEDRELLLALANEAPSENLFIIGDIETYGFDKDYQEIWYEEIDGKMESIYLKYRDNAVIYSSSNKMNPKEVVDLLDSEISKDINVYIGEELDDENLKDFSIVTLKSDEKDLGTIGIIGPKRMNYSKVISVMKYIQRLIDEGGI